MYVWSNKYGVFRIIDAGVFRKSNKMFGEDDIMFGKK